MVFYFYMIIQGTEKIETNIINLLGYYSYYYEHKRSN